MKALFIHQNFPGQFRHLAAHLARNPDNLIIGMGETAAVRRKEAQETGVHLVDFVAPRNSLPQVHHYLQSLEQHVLRGQNVVRSCMALKSKGFLPDLIIAHTAWGESLFIRDIFPQANIISYLEFFYQAKGADIGFDPEFPDSLDQRLMMRTLNSTQMISLTATDAGWSPTYWQKSLYPTFCQPLIEVMHEGIDTDLIKPDLLATWKLPNGRVLSRQDEVLTLANRSLEPYRGFHVFMRALPDIQKARPEAITLIVGNNEKGYGSMPEKASHWQAAMLDEVGSRLDMSRVHFLGSMAHADYLRVLQVSRAHAYLTYPFVLSWSMLEAMACGCTLIASRTPPVTEVISDAVNGLLFDFFDTEKLAELATAALSRPTDYIHLGAAARQTIIDRYDLRRISLPAQTAFLQQVLNRR